MNIAILGTGGVGRTLAAGLAALDHNIKIGTRDPRQTLARSEPDAMGTPPYRDWQNQNRGISLAPFAGAAAFGEIIFNCTSGGASLKVLQSAGEANLNGKVLVDVANPLDFSQGMPPFLSVCNTDSLGEQIQRAYPNVKVVKTLNTLNAALMTGPQKLAGGDHSLFICGNEAAAKVQATELLKGFGWQDIIDLGDISMARGTEMLLPVWLRLFGAFGHANFNFKIVR